MVRRRSTPPIHRWSRTIIAAIAAIGVLETAYLTIAKLTGSSVICPTSGCEKVLNSPYATVGGILPLSLLGFAAYLTLAILAVAPLAVNPETNKGLRSQLENSTWLLIFILATAMPIFSGYLMYLMIFQIGDLCIYCISSAVFSIALFLLTLFGREWEDIGQLFFTGTLVAMVTTLAALGLYNSNGLPSSNSSSPGIAPPAVTTVSGAAEIALARHLKQIGAKEYGAYWCPHCHEQKELFGNEAASIIDYIECDPKGKNSRTQLCEAAKIKGFPSWIINGKLYEGTQGLEELAQASGYTGPRNFQNAPQ
ncbi:MAG TPA: vitamin K epoxide reductase family protein [Kamptonema sp.]|nr:vitamin K epoxide reductase family protein [Kamptonema sp.]